MIFFPNFQFKQMLRIRFNHLLYLLPFLVFACGQHEETHLAKDTLPTIRAKTAKPGLPAPQNTILVSGQIQSAQQVQVSPRKMGYIEGFNVKVGDRVNKGQKLATVRNEALVKKQEQIETNLASAKIAMANAKKDYDRIQNLFTKQSATQKELDDIRTHYELMEQKVNQATKGLEEIQVNLSYTSLSAPISGLVVEKKVQSGEFVNPGRPVLVLENTNDYQAVVRIPEAAIAEVQKGDQVRITIDASNTQLMGRLVEISRSASGGQYLAKIDFNRADLKAQPLYSGMFIQASISSTGGGAAPQTPNPTILKSALYQKGQLNGVFVLNPDNVALLRWIRLGKDQGDYVEVLSGIKANETYIVSGDLPLINGAKIIVE